MRAHHRKTAVDIPAGQLWYTATGWHWLFSVEQEAGGSWEISF